MSGFLICGILLDNKDSLTYFRTFYIRRAFRILPLYFLILIHFAVSPWRVSVPSVYGDALPLWSYATFTQNFLMASEPQGTLHWFGVSWSLAIEEQFYLILPLIVYYTPRRALYSVFAAGIIGAVLLRLFLPGAHAFVLTPWRADSLLSGAMLALLVRRQPFMSWVALHRSALVTVFFALLAGAAVMIAKPWAPWARSHFWLAMFYTCFLLVALNDTFPMLTRFLTSGWLVWLGKVSYAVYLFHPDVAGLLFWFINRKSLELKSWSDYLIVALAVLTTLGLAALSFRLFEGPLVRFGHRFKYVTKEGGPFWAGRNTSS